jgi:hypothetical protein
MELSSPNLPRLTRAGDGYVSRARFDHSSLSQPIQDRVDSPGLSAGQTGDLASILASLARVQKHLKD